VEELLNGLSFSGNGKASLEIAQGSVHLALRSLFGLTVDALAIDGDDACPSAIVALVD
jgi:hypothetical protein